MLLVCKYLATWIWTRDPRNIINNYNPTLYQLSYGETQIILIDIITLSKYWCCYLSLYTHGGARTRDLGVALVRNEKINLLNIEC